MRDKCGTIKQMTFVSERWTTQLQGSAGCNTWPETRMGGTRRGIYTDICSEQILRLKWVILGYDDCYNTALATHLEQVCFTRLAAGMQTSHWPIRSQYCPDWPIRGQAGRGTLNCSLESVPCCSAAFRVWSQLRRAAGLWLVNTSHITLLLASDRPAAFWILASDWLTPRHWWTSWYHNLEECLVLFSSFPCEMKTERRDSEVIPGYKVGQSRSVNKL